MQAALSIAAVPKFSPLSGLQPPQQAVSAPRVGGSLACRRLSIKATATATYDTATVDYSSVFSVFPAEACETIGGDACLADMYPEVRLQAQAVDSSRRATESIERKYLQYDGAKTVFCAEACDDLGGEFCSREYQRGVY